MSTGRAGRAGVTGRTRARLAARPPPVTCDRACTSTPSARTRSTRSARVDPSGFEQLLAQGATELVDVPVERPADVRHDAAHERVAVGVQPAAGEGEHDVTGSDPVWAEHGIPLDDTGRSARDVVLVGLEQPGVLGRLAADERDPGLRAGGGDPRDDGRDPLGDDAPARDVVGHEERLRAADDDVVDDHADEVEADRVVPVEGLGDRDLGADAVGRGGEHRVVEVLEGGGVEHPGEARRGRRAPRGGWRARRWPASARRRGRRPRRRRRHRRT